MLLLACAPEPAPLVVADYAPALDSGTPAAVDPTSTLDAALVVLADLDPVFAFDAYDTALGTADSCPAVDPSYAPQHYWEDDCTTDTGAVFQGWALSYVARDVPIGDAFCLIDGYYFGFAQVSPGWSGYGEVRDLECATPTGMEITTTWRGDFVAESAWLAQSLSLGLYANYHQFDGVTTSTFDGALGFDAHGVYFDSVSVIDGCVTGTLTVFTPNGDATLTYTDACDGCTSACDGCAEPQSCSDWSALTTWDARPWS